MHPLQRQRVIEDEVKSRGLVTVDELVTRLSASPATIRRDLSALAQDGRIRRVRGGIEPVPASLGTASFEPSRFRNSAAKAAIAARAAELCKPGEPIIVNGGTTTLPMAEPIAELGLSVLTNSFPFANRLMQTGNCRVTLPGGEVYREQALIVSAFEQDTVIDHFYAARMFMSAQAIRPQGLIEGDPILIKSERKLIKQTDELIVLVDGSKFRGQGSLIVCPLDQADLVITDDSAPPEALAMLRKAGVATEVVAVDRALDETG